MWKKLTALAALAGVVLLHWGSLSAKPGGARKPAAVLTLPAELPSATGYTSEDALPGMRFSFPVAVANVPGETDRIFVVEKTGAIQVITNWGGKPRKSEFLNFVSLCRSRGASFENDGEMGAWGLAFHPQFSRNGYFYATYGFTMNDGGQRHSFDRLSRFSISKSDPNKAEPASEVPILTQLDLASNHNGGDIHFGADGYLYWCDGDEGGGNDNFNNSRFIDKDFFAGIFRLDVDKHPGNLQPNPHSQKSATFPSAIGPGTYLVPADNPFINTTSHSGRPLNPRKIRTELWCTGLRNPWRFSFDPVNQNMFIGNVGQDHWEQVYLGQKGGDYGWNYYEGSHEGPAFRRKPAGEDYLQPICEYSHRNGESGDMQGNCIIGGIVYRGSQFTDLFGTYIFSDYGNRRIWGLRPKADGWEHFTLIDRDDDMTGFAPDPRNGDVLMCSFGAGKIKRLIRRGISGNQPPALLSQTGAFSDTAKLTPANGLTAYEPNVAFWSDHAIKSRWINLPDNSTITFSRDGNWTFPTGTIWVKHFDMEMQRGNPASKRRLETRFLVKTADGAYGLTYKWRQDQSDADLVPETGMDEPLNITNDGQTKKQIWHYPLRNECMTCHTALAGYALGFNTRQLNGNFNGVNQIENLSDAGCFAEPVDQIESLPRFVKATDTTQPIEARVRSYLAVNCIQCHQPGGGAVGAWDARPEIALNQAKLINGQLVNNFGDPKNRWAVPGDPAHSIVLRRLMANGAPRMPPLASNELDEGAIKLMTQWIAQLPR
jgi:uncharacterized repeat protein (TIGR03806 family)